MPKLASAVTHQYVLKHQSSLVVAYASACASEVFRIFAPEQPYEKEETLRAVYENFNQTLGWLKYASSSSSRRKKDHDDEDEDDENEDDEDEDDEGEKEEKEEEEEDESRPGESSSEFRKEANLVRTIRAVVTKHRAVRLVRAGTRFGG